MGGWVGGTYCGKFLAFWAFPQEGLRPAALDLKSAGVNLSCRGWVGGWVGGWVDERKVEENEAVPMSYCRFGMSGWVGGWVGY